MENQNRNRSINLTIVFLMVSLIVGFANPAHGRWAPADNENTAIESTKKTRPASPSRVAFIQFKGPITHALHTYFLSRITKAKNAGIDMVILDIDSPGGLLDQSMDIANRLREIKWAHTVAYVRKEAISGAALIALGCDDIVIAEDALFGDIGVIRNDGTGAFRYAPAKINSYIVQEARKIAESKGRSGALAEAMIDKDSILYWNGEEQNPDYKIVRVDAEKPGDEWIPVEEAGKERFLTMNGKRAKQLGLADSIASDREALGTELNFDPAKAAEYKYTTTDSVVFWLNFPLITALLVIVGLIALYAELSAPGIGVGGLIAGLCAALFFWSRFMGGTSGWLEVVLFLAGLTFLAFELFIIPGFGVAGIMGLLLIVGSALMASQDFVIPKTNFQANQVATNMLMLLCSGAVFLVAAVFISKRLGKIPVFNRLILASSPGDDLIDNTAAKLNEDGKPVPSAHPDVSVGDWGTTESLLRPAGRAKFNRVSFDVVSDGSFIDAGAPVKVVEISGNRIVVTEVDDLLPETTYPKTEA